MREAPTSIFIGDSRRGAASFLHETMRITLSALILLSTVTAIAAESVSLTHLMPERIEHGMASVGLNRGFGSIWWPPEAKPVRIGDRTFAHGLGMRANNSVTYRLDGRYHRFQGWVGLDAEVLNKPEASAAFRVFGDGQALFDSGVMRSTDAAKSFDVSVEGIKELKIEAGDADDGDMWDHADWADPVLVGIWPRAKWSDGKAAYRVSGRALETSLDARGRLTGLKLSKSGLDYPIDGGSELEGCPVTDTRVEKTERGVRFHRTLSCGDRMTETFEPDGNGVCWELDIHSEGKARGGRINTFFRWLKPQSARLWTAWGGGVEWIDPLQSWDYRTEWYEYGTFFNRSQGVSLPMFTVLDRENDAAFTLLQDFEDKITKMNLSSDEDGTLEFSRYDLRLGEGRHWRFRVGLLPHAAEVRAALGAVVARHPLFFDPPNPLADQIGGHAAYSSSDGDLGSSLKEMGLTYNWKASFDFPYMGMFLPPVLRGVTWPSFGGESDGVVDNLVSRSHPVSADQLADYSARMRRAGFHVLNYFNVTEFGTGIEFPAPPRRTAEDRDLWRDPNDFLHYAIPSAILRAPKPRYTWGRAVVMDCGEPAYKNFLLEQARRHVQELPDASGICIDRMDWLDMDNPNADDGLTWNERPVRSLLNSWQDLMVELGPIFHNADKVIFGNPMVRRPDLARFLDGFYDEHGDFGFSINTTSFLALRKPATMWTREEAQLRSNPDDFMQQRLYMGVFLTAPVPGNDHCLQPGPWVERLYLDYGPLFSALRGRKWVLLPKVIEVEKPALANVFEVPSGYVLVIGLAGARRSVPVTLRNIQVEGFRAEVIAPGEKTWQPLPVVFGRKSVQFNVPIRRGGAVVRWIRPSPLQGKG